MENYNKRIEAKIDTIIEKITSIEVEQAKQHVTLQEHTKRSTMLEEDVKPIRRFMAQVQGGLKLLGILGTLAGALKLIQLVIK